MAGRCKLREGFSKHRETFPTPPLYFIGRTQAGPRRLSLLCSSVCGTAEATCLHARRKPKASLRVVEQKTWEALNSTATLPNFVSELKTELRDLQDHHNILLVAQNHILLFKTKGSPRKFQGLGVEKGPETSPKRVLLISPLVAAAVLLQTSEQIATGMFRMKLSV